jgi:hypothetical protein
MYASGSTWLFNATRDVAAVLYPDQRITGHFAEGLKGLKKLPPALNVVKTHDLPQAAAGFLLERADVILISLRDPRDAVTSMMQHMGESFLQALQRVETSAHFAARFAGDARAVLFPYESGFTESEAAFGQLAAALGETLTQAQRRDLFAATRRSKIEKKISQLTELPTVWRNPATGDVVDTDTQWHHHHAGRSGESGRWRRMLPPQGAALIEKRMAGFMQAFGYLGDEAE